MDHGVGRGTRSRRQSEKGETVQNEAARDFVTGAGGDDWFFFDRDRDKDTAAANELFAGELEWTGA